MKSNLAAIILAVSLTILLTSCLAAPESTVSPEPVDEPTATPTPAPAYSPDPSPTATDFPRLDRVQKNLSIDELYEQFPRKIIATYQDGEYMVDVERIYRNYSSEGGGVYPLFSFDKLILSGEGDAVEKFNAMFDNDATGFFYGHENSLRFQFGQYDLFNIFPAALLEPYGLPVMEETSSVNGEDLIGKMMVCIFKTKVTYLGESVLSVREDNYWQGGGHLYTTPYGMTLDLNTGELLPVSYFVGDDLENLKQIVIDMLYESIDTSNPFRTESHIEGFSKAQEGYEFSDYEYYYDGAHVFLLVPGLDWYGAPYVLQLPGTYSAGC